VPSKSIQIPKKRAPESGPFAACCKTRSPKIENLMNNNLPADSIEAVTSGLASAGYIASRQIATAVYLAERIEKPILVEGPAGVGKTELAKALAAWRGLRRRSRDRQGAGSFAESALDRAAML